MAYAKQTKNEKSMEQLKTKMLCKLFVFENEGNYKKESRFWCSAKAVLAGVCVCVCVSHSILPLLISSNKAILMATCLNMGKYSMEQT